MTRWQLLRLQLRSLRLRAWDRSIDFLNMAVPIFIVSGILVASIRFWWWVLA
jgi:hypothetical protein